MSTNVLITALILSTIGSLAQAAGPAIAFEVANVIENEDNVLSFHLIAIGTFNDDLSVEVIVEPLTATPLVDYVLVANPSGNTTHAHFTVGHTNSSMIMILLTDNNAWEPLECFTVRIMIPPGVEAMLGSPSSMTVCIYDDDEVEISFMEDTVMVDEDIGGITLQLKAEGIYTTPFNVTVTCLEVFPIQARVSGLRMNDTDAYPNSYSVEFSDLASPDDESLSTEMTINFNDDLLSEPTECFICLILRPFATRGIHVKDPDTLTVCIKDNDVLKVCFASNDYNGTEGNSVIVQLKATGEFVQPFKARIFSSSLPPEHQFKAVEAEEGEDYISPRDVRVNGGIVEFNPDVGQGSTQLSLLLFEDDIVEETEYFRLNFAFEEDPNNPSPIVLSKCSPSEVLVAIQDNNEIFVRFEHDKYLVDENSGLVNVRLQAVQEKPPNSGIYVKANYTFDFNVSLITLAGSAKAPSDFMNKTSVVTFSSGMEFSSNFTVNIVDNEEAECLESFTIEFMILEIMAQVKVLDSNTATVNIKDDDLAFLSFTVNSAKVKEGVDTSITLTVMSSNTFQDDQVVGISAMDGEAESPTDYVLTTTMATLRAGQTEFTVDISITDNLKAEQEEAFMVELNLSDSLMDCGGRIGVNGSVTITIEDDAGPTVAFQRANMIGNEGNILSFRLIAIGTFNGDFSVEVLVEPLTATPLLDYALLANPLGNTTLAHFTVGQTNSSMVMILLTNDNSWEPQECFTASIVIPPGAEAMVGSPSSTRICINDDDEVEISFMEDTVMVDEGMGVLSLQLKAEGIYTTRFSLTVSCLDVFPVQAKVSGQKTNETDAYPNSHSVQFSDFQSSESKSTKMTININDDLLSEPTECFICRIQQPFGTRGINVKDPFTLTICIKDNDVLGVCFVRNEYNGIEGNSVTVQLKTTGEFVQPFKARIFSSSLPPEHQLKTVEAEEGQDYISPRDGRVNGKLVEFDPELGTVSRELSLMLVEDDIVEKTEYFRLNFTFEEDPHNPSPIPLSKCSPEEVLVAIQDNDEMFVRFEHDEYLVSENSSLVNVHLQAVQEDPPNSDVYIKAKYTFDFDVSLITSAGSAKAPSDFLSKAGVVTFSSGMEFSSNFTVNIVDNEEAECLESFKVEFVNPNMMGQVKVLDPNSATVNIKDDDLAFLSFTVNSANVKEGVDTSITLTVMSSNPFQDDQVVGISAMDGEAESPTDYVLTTTMATLRAGQTEFTVDISITDNRDVEDNEAFMVELNLSDLLMDCGGRIGVNGSVTVTIQDDDVFIRVKGGAKRVVREDDNFISFQLEVVNGTVVNEFSVNTIPVESTPVSARGLADFTAIGGALEAVFAVGANLSTETRITIIDDNITDCDETFQVIVSPPPGVGGVFLLEPTTIDVVIMDNDPVELMFNHESLTVTEGSSLIIEDFYLVATNSFERDQEIAIVAFNGTASSGFDFNLLTTSVTIKAYTMRSDPIRVMIVNDTIVEDEEMFQLGVVLSDELPSCGVELGDPSMVNITIEDDDPVYVGLNLRRIPRTIREGNGSAVIQLEVENGTVFFPINVTVTVREIGMGPGHALEFLDFYVFGDENLARFDRFDNVSTSAEIRTVDNEICEDDEDFEIQITIDPVKQPRVILVEPTTLRLTIEDDDTENCFPPTVVSFTSDAVRIVERGKKYRLPVHRIGRLENDLTIKVITKELTATEGDDFIIITKRIRFRKTSSSYGQANIQYTVPDKDGVEPREAFRIVLEAPDGVMIRQADVTIIITDEN